MDAAYAAAYPDLYRRHWWWRVREEILLRHIGRLLSDRRDARILDVGCGAGLFFDALDGFGRIEGIESDPAALAASGRWRSRIHAGELDASYTPSAAFDLILMLDVLEHIEAPDPLLRRAADLLAPAGHLLVTVPAFNWLWTAHDELNKHARRYSAAELRRALEQAGLRVEQSSYLFQSLVVPKVLVRMKEAMTSPRPHVPAIPPPWINDVVQRWFRAEHAVMGWLPFGSSLLSVARRRE